LKGVEIDRVLDRHYDDIVVGRRFIRWGAHSNHS
jgi:hypothetical protein